MLDGTRSERATPGVAAARRPLGDRRGVDTRLALSRVSSGECEACTATDAKSELACQVRVDGTRAPGAAIDRESPAAAGPRSANPASRRRRGSPKSSTRLTSRNGSSGSVICTSQDLRSTRAFDLLVPPRKTSVRHLARRAATAGDAQHRAPRRHRTPDRLVRCGGAVTAIYGSRSFGGPVSGGVDRRGPTTVLLAIANVSAALLAAIASLSKGAPLGILIACTAGIGLAPADRRVPRTQLPARIDPRDARAIRRAVPRATETGPTFALAIDALGTAARPGGRGVILLTATAAFALQPASRTWRPAAAGTRPPGGSLRAPAMRTLVIVLIAVGVLLGATRLPSRRPPRRLAARSLLRRCSPSGGPDRWRAACSLPESVAGRALVPAWPSS